MKRKPATPLLITVATLALGTAFSSAANISYVGISNDANSGISSTTTYTHKLDFGQGATGALINQVQFNPYLATDSGTLNFNQVVSSGNASDNSGNSAHNVSGGLVSLMTDMIFNGANDPGGTVTWTLSGLTAGTVYDTRIYTRRWDANVSRFSTLVFDPDGAGAISDSTGPIDEDNATSVGFSTAQQAYYINYRFTAVAGENLVITATQAALNQSWHLYGLTNQVVPEPSGAALIGLGGIALLLRRRR